MFFKLVCLLLLLTISALPIPPNDKDLFENNDLESRRGHRRRRPCRGKSAPEGRLFFDWSYQLYDINYNYNYNYNCGESGGGVGQKPIGSGQKPFGGGGGGQKPFGSGGGGQKPIFNGDGGQGTGGLAGAVSGPLNFVQSQVQNIVSDGPGSLLPDFGGFFDGLGSLFSPGGLFNGQGILSLFDGGLFNNIFNRPSGGSGIANPPKPDGQDPDDIIYNDEKPVHEDHDDVLPDKYSKPAPYQNRQRSRQNNRYNNFRFT